MAIETEIKIRVPDMEQFRRKLKALNPRVVAERHLEDNLLLDYPDGRLRSRACLMRVRKTPEKETMTFKGPPRPSRLFKSREELETRVASADVVLQIFEQIGITTWFRYQKYREEYAIPLSTGMGDELQLVLDATPIGDFAELEGSEGGIKEVASRLGFTEAQYLRESYYALFLEFCRQRGKRPGDMIFAGKEPAEFS